MIRPNIAANAVSVKQDDPLNDPVQGTLTSRTHLIQLYTTDPDEGPRLVSDSHPMGVPIMILVDPPSCCYYKLNVPHGIVSLEQKWGKKQGMIEPGCHCCYCSHKRIAAMVTKNSIESCPTKDNVRVSVDIGITFHIGKEESRQEDCEKFLYYLGANKLEELLEQESEESIRNFIRQHKVSQIRDIKSELTTQMMSELNQKFNQYGVFIETVNVMNVVVPKDLRNALQLATTYDVHLQNQIKFQDNTKLKMMNENNMQLLALKRDNLTKIVNLQHTKKMEEISLEEAKVQAETKQQLELIKAREAQNVKVIQAEAVKAQAEKKSKKQASELLAEARAYAEAKMIQANNKVQILNMMADNRLKSAKLKSSALIVEADAEGAQAANLENKRKHEQRMTLAGDLAQLSKNNKIVVSGKQGEQLLGFFRDTGDMVNSIQLD